MTRRSEYLLDRLGRYEVVRAALHWVTSRWVGPEPDERFALPDPLILAAFHSVGSFVRAHRDRVAGQHSLEECCRRRRAA